MDHIAGSLLGILIVSCNYGEHTPAGSNNTAIDPAANNTPFKNTSVLVTDTIFAGNMDTAVIFKEGEVWIAGRIIANKKQPKYAVSGEKGQTVTATIKAVVIHSRKRVACSLLSEKTQWQVIHTQATLYFTSN